MFEKRINIFTGHFGSGKTEVAVNFACRLSEKGNKTAIMDFDIVNPYFRTADVKEELSERGILVVTTVYANTNVDVPAIPAEVESLFAKKEYKVVFDVGGDDIGARALSRYRDQIMEDQYEMFFVVNTNRPMTNTVEKIEEMIREIEYTSRIRVSKLVNNTNLLQDSSLNDIISGQELINQVSERLNIPIGFTSGFSSILGSDPGLIKSDILYMEKLIKLPWQ